MAKIQKLYDISLLGEKEVIAGLRSVNIEFDRVKTNVISLKAEASKQNHLIVNPNELNKEKQALLEAEKALIRETSKKIEARAEAQALMTARQLERNETQKMVSTNKNVAGSYNEIAKELRELKAEQKANVNILNIDEAELQRTNHEIRELQDRINSFNRSLSSEGTNVGEYTRGIINSLKSSGLDGLITSQIDKAKLKVQELDNEFKNLSGEIRRLRASGETNFSSLERRVIQNRKEAEKYRDQLKRVQQEMRGMGSIGEQVTRGLNSHFKQLRGQISGMILGYISLHTAMNAINTLKTNAIQFDSARTAIEAVSKDSIEAAKNLNYLDEVSEKYGQNLLDISKAYKAFYAASTQSNISADNTRMIFESVMEAAGVLKLSQEDVNGTLIAFGQIASKGKVMAEELRGQIGERLPGAFQIAAKAMGVTNQELEKMMKKGEIYAQDFLPKFARELQKSYSAGGESVKGLQAEMNRLNNLMNKIAQNKNFVNFISLSISGIKLLAQAIMSIPFSVWITFVVLLTAAYWNNIVALSVKTVALGRYIILRAAGNILIATATLLEGAQTVVTWALNIAKAALNATLILLGVSTATLNTMWALLNATFLATPVGWIIVGIMAIGAAIVAVDTYINRQTNSIKQQGEEMRRLANAKRLDLSISKQATEATSKTIAKLEILTKTVKNSSNSLETRKKALNDLISISPKYLNGLTLENIETAKGVKILDDYKNKLIEIAKAKAAQNMLVEKQTSIIENEMKLEALSFELAEDAKNKYGKDISKTRKTINFGKDLFKWGASDVGIGEAPAGIQIRDISKQLEKDKQDLDDFLTKYVNDAFAKSLLDDEAETVSVKEGKAENKSKTDPRLKLIDDQRDAQLAIEKRKKIENEIDEEKYLDNILSINNIAIAKKLAIIKGSNTEEIKMIEELKTEIIQNEHDTNKLLFDIQKKQLESSFELEKDQLQKELDQIINQENIKADVKEEAEQIYYENLLSTQLSFNDKMSELENDFRLQSEENARERANVLYSIEQELLKNTYELSKARFDEMKKVIETSLYNKSALNEIERQTNRLNILNDKKLSDKKKDIELNRNNIDSELKLIQLEIDSVNKMILIYQLRYGEGAKLHKEYQELLVAQKTLNADAADIGRALKRAGKKEINAPSNQNTQKIITDLILESFQLNEDDYRDLVGYAIAQSFDMAAQAMNDYFDAEKQRIEYSKKLAFERIDLDKKQLIARAQSQGEIEMIEKQADQKKQQVERDAGNRLKNIKKKEAQIAFAMELANIWSTVWQLGTVYGLIAGSALTALATAKFAMTNASISSVKYGDGGLLSGPAHSDNNGMPIINPKTGAVQAYVEGDEAIINKRSMKDNNVYSIMGTPAQIASGINSIGGGVDFLGGATMRRFADGGYLGSQVKPPVFRSYIDRQKVASTTEHYGDRLAAIEDLLASTVGTLNREVNRKTIVVEKDITDIQNDVKKQTKIATL